MQMPEGEVFIATSLDGYIARPDGDVSWLTSCPLPEGEDFGYSELMERVDALVLGRKSYEKVLSFGEWPYAKPVTVLSRTLPPCRACDTGGKVAIRHRDPLTVMEELGRQGARRVYVDGGAVVSAFLRAGLIEQMTITRLPILLGDGIPLFCDTGEIALRHEATRSWPNGFVQSVYSVG